MHWVVHSDKSTKLKSCVVNVLEATRNRQRADEKPIIAAIRSVHSLFVKSRIISREALRAQNWMAADVFSMSIMSYIDTCRLYVVSSWWKCLQKTNDPHGLVKYLHAFALVSVWSDVVLSVESFRTHPVICSCLLKTDPLKASYRPSLPLSGN